MAVTNFTVGPAKNYHGVAAYLQQIIGEGWGEKSHRSAEFTKASQNTQAKLREFFRIPDDYTIFYTYSSTEGMEILTRSLVNQKCTHVVNGSFSKKWWVHSQRVGQDATKLQTEDGTRFPLDAIEIESDTEMLVLTGNETSTGLAYSPEEIKTLRERFLEVFFCVDITSGMGAVGYDFDQADAWFFSVQKALGMPAGLGILIVNDRVMAKAKEREEAGADIGCHHTLFELQKKIDGKCQTPTTPNVLNILTLGFVAEKFLEDFGSIDQLYSQTKAKHAALISAIDQIKGLDVVSNSETVIVVQGSEERISSLKAKLSDHGYSVGGGYGANKPRQIRIGNFPVHTLEDHARLLDLIKG